MALIQTGALITNLSGKIGGQSFAYSRSGLYLKNIGRYPSRGTNAQQSARQRLAFIAQSWSALRPSQRNGWNSGAETNEATNRFGMSYVPSGFQLFMDWNTRMYFYTGLYNEGYPTGGVLGDVGEVSIISDFSNAELIVSTENTQEGCIYGVWAYISPSAGITTRPKNFFWCKTVTSTQMLNGIDCFLEIFARFPYMRPGMTIWIEVDQVETGTGRNTRPRRIGNGLVVP